MRCRNVAEFEDRYYCRHNYWRWRRTRRHAGCRCITRRLRRRRADGDAAVAIARRHARPAQCATRRAGGGEEAVSTCETRAAALERARLAIHTRAATVAIDCHLPRRARWARAPRTYRITPVVIPDSVAPRAPRACAVARAQARPAPSQSAAVGLHDATLKDVHVGRGVGRRGRRRVKREKSEGGANHRSAFPRRESRRRASCFSNAKVPAAPRIA